MRDAGAVLGRYEIRRVHLPPVLAVFQRRIPRVVIKGWFVLDSNNIGPLSFVLIYGDTADFAETFFRKDKPFTALFGSTYVMSPPTASATLPGSVHGVVVHARK